ncbi:CatB-related O-acetyltransferase [Paenibacillus sp. MER TA 81-3]|nr:CatB-related O-acetyltransferase [Paenibacillus sp. MER TA 81-3]
MILETIVHNLSLIDEQLMNKNIIIFGTGKGGRLTHFVLKTMGYSITYFVDNDQSTWNKSLLGNTIHSPASLLNEQKDNVIVLVASMYHQDISEQLVSMGLVLNENFKFALLDEAVIEKKQVQTNTTNINYEKHRKTHYYKGVEIGRYTYGYDKLEFIHVVEKIGSFCSINRTAYIGANHPVNYISTSPIFYQPKGMVIGGGELLGVLKDEDVPNFYEITNNRKIVVGNDVWIGAYAVILPSIKIGNGAIIAAGAVVNRDVPDYAIVGGVPAKIIRYRFTEEEIKKLNEIKWWDWPEEEIIKNARLFMNNKLFFKKYSNFL